MEQIHSGPMTGRTVLVTGSSGGIGRATALGLAAMGAHLAITGRDRGRTEDAAREIRAAGSRQVDVFVADLSSLSQVRRLADEVLQMSSMRKTALVAGIFARFDAFGMYTRRTARGFHDVMDWCTRTATSALASGVNAAPPRFLPWRSWDATVPLRDPGAGRVVCHSRAGRMSPGLVMAGTGENPGSPRCWIYEPGFLPGRD